MSKRKIEIASRDNIYTHQAQVSVILVAIGFVLRKDDPLAWSDEVLVTDGSKVWDFLGSPILVAPETTDYSIKLLSQILNLPVSMNDLIYKVAEARVLQQKDETIQ